jgi:hypothetical protein
MGALDWTYTSYDNSTFTETRNWVEVEDFENHIKATALTIIRISPDVPLILRKRPYYTWNGVEYWVVIVEPKELPIRLISNY